MWLVWMKSSFNIFILMNSAEFNTNYHLMKIFCQWFWSSENEWWNLMIIDNPRHHFNINWNEIILPSEIWNSRHTASWDSSHKPKFWSSSTIRCQNNIFESSKFQHILDCEFSHDCEMLTDERPEKFLFAFCRICESSVWIIIGDVEIECINRDSEKKISKQSKLHDRITVSPFTTLRYGQTDKQPDRHSFLFKQLLLILFMTRWTTNPSDLKKNIVCGRQTGYLISMNITVT
jgi:hypothetical protein